MKKLSFDELFAMLDTPIPVHLGKSDSKIQIVHGHYNGSHNGYPVIHATWYSNSDKKIKNIVGIESQHELYNDASFGLLWEKLGPLIDKDINYCGATVMDIQGFNHMCEKECLGTNKVNTLFISHKWKFFRWSPIKVDATIDQCRRENEKIIEFLRMSKDE